MTPPIRVHYTASVDATRTRCGRKIGPMVEPGVVLTNNQRTRITLKKQKVTCINCLELLSRDVQKDAGIKYNPIYFDANVLPENKARALANDIWRTAHDEKMTKAEMLANLCVLGGCAVGFLLDYAKLLEDDKIYKEHGS
jgi:hypothetical protein